VSLALVDAFAEAPRAEQVQALGELRKRVEDDSTAIELGLLGAALGALFTIVGPGDALPEVTNVLTGLVFGILGGLTVVLVVSPGLFAIALRSNRRDAAAAWLTAYEDELARRRSARGRHARAWQRAH